MDEDEGSLNSAYLGGLENGRSGLEAAARSPGLTPPSLALGSVRRRPPRRSGRSGSGGQARPCPGHRSAPAPGRRCLPSGCGALRAARSRSPGRCQVAGPASCLHGPGARRRRRRRRRRCWRRRRRRTSRRRPGSRPPGQRRRRLRPGSSALQPAPARPPVSLALLSSLWSLALLLPIRLLGLHCRDT